MLAQPQRIETFFRTADRRIALDAGTPFGIGTVIEMQHVHADLGGDPPPVIAQDLQLGGGRYVEHMEAAAVAMGQIDGAARGPQCGLLVTDPRVVRHDVPDRARLWVEQPQKMIQKDD